MSMTFGPRRLPLRGTLRVPGDKSLSHRAVLLAAMARGTSRLEALLDSDDVRSSIGAVRALGAGVRILHEGDGLIDAEVTGWADAGPTPPDGPIDCGNSGTTTRLLMGVLATLPGSATLVGDASLSRRPMRRVTEPLTAMGVGLASAPGGTLPVTVTGSPDLHPVDWTTSVASAQVKTAILLAGLQAHGRTTVHEPAASRDHTERMLPGFGVPVEVRGTAVSVEGPVVPTACDVRVPGDPSSAAFLLGAAAVCPGSCVTTQGVSLNPTRTGFLEVLRRMGASVSIGEGAGVGREPVGDITVRGDGRLHAVRVVASEVPSLVDEVPLLALVATFADGVTCFEQVGELRVKESDRLQAIIDGLGALGCRAWAEGDDLFVEGGAPTRDATLCAAGDHRLAMCWALAGTCGGVRVTVEDIGCVSVSYPGFLADLARLTDDPDGYEEQK